jgi:hypothetical protein
MAWAARAGRTASAAEAPAATRALGLTPLAISDDRRPLEGFPRGGRFLPRPRVRMRPGTVVLGLGDRPPRGGGWGHRCRLDRPLARHGEELPRPLEPVAERVAVAARAGERRQLGLGVEGLGAEPYAQERGLLSRQAPQALAGGVLGVVPPSFPQRELGAGAVEGGQAPLVVVDGRERSLEVGVRPVEVTAADVERGPLDETPVLPLGTSGANRGGAHTVSLLPLADVEQCLHEVDDQWHVPAVLGPVLAGEGDPGGGHLDGLARPPEHGEHVGEEDVGPPQILRDAAVLGEPKRPPQAAEPFLGTAEVGKVALLHLAITALDVLHQSSERPRRCSGLIALSTSYSRPDGKRLHFAIPRRRLRPRCNSAPAPDGDHRGQARASRTSTLPSRTRVR